MSFTGQFGKITQLRQQLDSLSKPAALEAVAREMASAALGFTDQEFQDERAPFGSAWAAKKRPDGRKIGQGKTGNLRRYRVIRADAQGFTVGPNAAASPYAKYFAGGKRGQRARPVTPSGAGNRLPRAWRDSFTRIWLGHIQIVKRAA